MERLTLRDVPGLRVGHVTDEEAVTGCTVLAPPAPRRGRVRGAPPGTAKTDLLAPGLAGRGGVHAICFPGGSAFGSRLRGTSCAGWPITYRVRAGGPGA